MDSTRDLDRGLRPQTQQRTEGSSNRIQIDPDNLMDNWFVSARETRKQRDSSEPRDRRAWGVRRRLHPLPKGTWLPWQYTQDGKQRRWVVPRNDHHAFSLGRKTGELALNEPYGCLFPSEAGDSEISWIYWTRWVSGDVKGFLDMLYSKYGVEGTIPEPTIWKIFASLVSELVPEDQARTVVVPTHLMASPDTIWQVGKCMLHVLTRGRFWDDDYNCLSPKDNGQKFGNFKQHELQSKYSKNLMKYVLGCLSAKEYERFTSQDLMAHFQKVHSVFAGTYVPEPVRDSLDGPYTSTDPRIPTGLTEAEGKVYEDLLEVLKERQEKTKMDGRDRTPHIVTITDLAKDYDDLMAMMCLAELDRLGIVQLEGFVANLTPAWKRALFGRGALDELGLPHVKIGIGSVGDSKRALNNYGHEFAHTEAFLAPGDTPLPEGQHLLTQIFEEAAAKRTKLTLLTISSLMDIAQFSQDHVDLFKDNLSHVVLQGGYRVTGGKLVPDPAAANNRFDLDAADAFHEFLHTQQVPSTVWTKVAANATPICSSLFEFLEETGHPLGRYLRGVQTSQELNFYRRCCSGRPFAPHMTPDWVVKTKSTWFAAGHEPDEEYPEGEDMLPYFTKVVAYDALAVVGASGDDVLEHFQLVRPLVTRPDAHDTLHRIVGVPKMDAVGDADELPEEANLDGWKMGIALSALMKGSILAVQQKLSMS